MTKKYEELVEEIRLVWCKDCGDGPSRYEYSPDLDDDACEGGVVTIKLCRERARECVRHILSAVRDGRLELPGEEWRAQAWIEDGHENFPRGRVEVRPPLDALKGFPRQQAFDVIALTGTGKEGDIEV